jgi:hypothetical protein
MELQNEEIAKPIEIHHLQLLLWCGSECLH